jgi:predicted metal-dependent peptidase
MRCAQPLRDLKDTLLHEMIHAVISNKACVQACQWLNCVFSAAACGARRPLRDLKDTLLHEMIHAELFLKGVRDDGDHGKAFRWGLDAS